MKPPATALVALLLLCTACAQENGGEADSAPPGTEADPLSQETASPGEANADSGRATTTLPSAPFKGITHQVNMTGDAEGFRFDPPDLSIAEGDAIRFIVVGNGPHNVVFDGQDLTSDAQTRLDQQISDRIAPLTSAILSESGEAITVLFAGIPAGRYPFFCATHGAAGMRGTVTVQ